MSTLETPGFLDHLSTQLLEDIEQYAVETYSGEFRWHLGASEIGRTCDNYLWLKFRWAFNEQFDGRRLRLFQRGHREEAYFIEYLEGIGCKVYTEDLTNNDIYVDQTTFEFYNGLEAALKNSAQENLKKLEQHDSKWIKIGKALGFKFPQFKFKSTNAHFGGSKDALIFLPERYGVEGAIPLLGEFKTNGTGAGFNKLVASKMKVAKPQHWAQVCSYGVDEQIPTDHAAYFNVNKNDDSLHIEVVKLDKKHGEKMKARADRIIASDAPMVKVSNNKTYFECVGCAAKNVCHEGGIPEKNCRSCKFAIAVPSGEWACTNTQPAAEIPRDFVKTGCDDWHPITATK